VLHGRLRRLRATAQQVGLSRPERAQNVQGAFRVPPAQRAEVAGKRLVLVDDVLTSGATANTVPAPCCGQVPPMSTCWYSPGLLLPCGLSYNDNG
jgi:hypoxanthine-guanine phosphoribosyltransferase